MDLANSAIGWRWKDSVSFVAIEYRCPLFYSRTDRNRRYFRRQAKKDEHEANARNRSYPKHVWSPAGGWYAQPANWRGNTLVAGAVIFGIVAVTWKFGAERENWAHKPQPGEWYPSRKYVNPLGGGQEGVAEATSTTTSVRATLETIFRS